MLSESARASSAAELRYRIQAPNAQPRATAVFALDAAAADVLATLAQTSWGQATFLLAPAADAPGADDGWVTDLHGRRSRVSDQVNAADQVLMLAGAGGGAEGAACVGRACSRKRVMTTGLIVGAAGARERELAKTLAQMRPWSLMLVVAGDDDYLADMMTALRV